MKHPQSELPFTSYKTEEPTTGQTHYGPGDPGETAPSARMLFYYHPDYLGNVEYITDLDGIPHQYFWYSPWGEALKDQKANSNAWETPYQFNGKEIDKETGLYYYGARYYNPSTSVWLSVDPFAHMSPNQTPYHFVSNNPIMRIDPDGNRDYYNQQGLLKYQDKIEGPAVVLLGKNVKESIASGSFAVIPTPAVFKKMDEAYNLSEANGNTEYGGAVGSNGSVSTVVGGQSEVYLNLTPAHDEIKSSGEDVLYDFHVHGKVEGSDTYKPSTSDSKTGSYADTEKYQKEGGIPDMVLGYKNVEKVGAGTVAYGAAYPMVQKKYVGFYTNIFKGEINYETLRNLSDIVYKE